MDEDKKIELWNELIQFSGDLNYFFRKQLDYNTLNDLEYAIVLSEFIKRNLEQLNEFKTKR